MDKNTGKEPEEEDKADAEREDAIRRSLDEEGGDDEHSTRAPVKIRDCWSSRKTRSSGG